MSYFTYSYNQRVKICVKKDEMKSD